MPLQYVIGDATLPQGTGPKIIAHCCNNAGYWGSGFVVALSRQWSKPEAAYRSMKARPLGTVQIVPVRSDITVVNIIGQNGIRGTAAFPPIRYEALRMGLIAVSNEAHRIGASVHMPMIGAGRAGGDWTRIEPIIKETLDGLDVYVYQFPSDRA